ARPRRVVLTRDVLDEYSGQYLVNAKPDAPMATIVREGDHLTVSFPFRPQPLVLEPISETEFDMPYTDGRFTFRKDKAGQVTGVLFHIGDSERDMKKVAPGGGK